MNMQHVDMQKIAGFGLGLLGTFLMWQTGVGLAQFFHADGTAHIASLMFDPQHSLRLMCAMAAFIAGLAALTEREGGAWLAGFASSLLLLQTLALMGGHGSVLTWQREAVFLIILTSLFLTLVIAQGKKEDQETDPVPA